MNKLYRIDQIARQEDHLQILRSCGTYSSAKRDHAALASLSLFGWLRDQHADQVAGIRDNEVCYPARRRGKLSAAVLHLSEHLVRRDWRLRFGAICVFAVGRQEDRAVIPQRKALN